MVPAFAVLLTSTQVPNFHKAAQIVVDIVTVILAPHRLAIEPARPHFNGTERIEINPNHEDSDVIPEATGGLIGECGAECFPVTKSAAVQ